MDKTIQTLLNGYEQPAFLSDAENGNIIFLNNAARRRFGFSRKQLVETSLYDLFNSRRIVRQSVIWERREKQFEINEEKLEIANVKYIHSVIKPIEKPRQLLDLLEMQKEMAKLMVHLFHSPFNGITGFTELLKGLGLTKKQAQYVNSIEEGLGEFKQILSRIRSLGEDIEVQQTAIDVQSFSRNVLDQYPHEEKKRIELTIDPDIIELHSDFVLLKDIITELLDNALEFSPDSHQNVKLDFRDDNIIRVTSFGPQIPEQFTEKMFYPFFSNKARGIGLGLSKCVYFAHKLGYQIVLSQNSSAKGISFDIRMK